MTPPADLTALGVESFEELHVLLAVARAGEDGTTPQQLGTELNLPAETVSDALDRFTASGLLVQRHAPGPRYAVDRSNTRLSTELDRLQAEFASNPLPLITRLSSLAVERVRQSAIRAFAGAFVLRGKKDG